MEFLKENERIDDIQLKGLRLIQNTDGFCFGVDAVLLANFCKIRPGDEVVDLGTGTGIIPIILAGKSRAKSIKGIEIQEEVSEMASRSVKLNKLEDRISIMNVDLKELKDHLPVNHFDVVTSNPPYMHCNGIINENDKKAISRHEVKCTLEDVMKTASGLLKHRGKFFMIHRPIRLADIISMGRQYKLEPKLIRFIHPKVGKAPNLMLIQFTKAANPELKILDPLYVYEENGEYTKEINDIYSQQEVGGL